ncbi:MAG: AMP-binding protein, partial [Acidimicrobiales bacterium]
MSDISIDASQAEQFRAAGWWRDRTFLEDFDQTVAAYQDKVAIVSRRHDDPAAMSVLSYRQLGRYVDRFAGALVDLGVEPGQIVSVQLPNNWQFAALALAC